LAYLAQTGNHASLLRIDTMTTLYSTSPDGTRIAYELTGRGPALMLLHGAGKTRRDWRKAGYIERLKDDFTVITVDIRGSGDSDSPIEIGDYSIEKIYADLLAVADVCNVSHFAIWGYSFGGNIARYLGAWSERVTSVAVIGVPFGPAVDDDFDRFIDEFIEKWEPLVQAQHKDSLDEKDRQSAIKGRVPVWLSCFQAMRKWPSIEPGDMRCPAMLFVGTRNKNTLGWVQANRLTLDRTNVCVAIVEGLNHMQEFTQIDRVFPSVASFLFRHGCIHNE
jgi:pimeloyl-ACP methyl ester carboxylesterase